MNAIEAINAAVLYHHEGEPLTTEDIDLHEVEELAEAVKFLRDAERHLAAATAVRDVARTRVGELLGEGGAIRHGDRLIRYRKRWRETVIDSATAADYMTAEIRAGRLEVGDIVNPQYAKRSWMSDAVRDTFYERGQEQEPTVDVTPMSKAPKFLAELEDGEVFRSDR